MYGLARHSVEIVLATIDSRGFSQREYEIKGLGWENSSCGLRNVVYFSSAARTRQTSQSGEYDICILKLIRMDLQ